MTCIFRKFVLSGAVVFLLFGVLACSPDGKVSGEADQVLRIGIIATLSGPGRSWGETTVTCARVIADHYNEKGGIRIGDRRYRIELLVEDDKLDPVTSMAKARKLVMKDGVRYLIGPFGDDAVTEVAPFLDAYNICYVHYGFSPALVSEDSLGILGMPTPVQTLPIIYDYLSDELGYGSVLVLARNSEEALYQKRIAESVAESRGVKIKHLARFDIVEETFRPGCSAEDFRYWVRQVVESDPDAILMAGIPPGDLVALLSLLRRGGFKGVCIAQNSQEPAYLSQLTHSEVGDFYYVGGRFPVQDRTPLYLDLMQRYREILGEPSMEVDTQFYALQMLLLSLQAAGPEALDDASRLRSVMEASTFEDPFFAKPRKLAYVGETSLGAKRQIATPIVLSRYQSGSAQVVHFYDPTD
ncbi:ABC transporter substrate-binding protein [Coraliomargarita parva]|uniref:ABC transporter substrate-binding protein n=1 Tax=Coraliomargarita parva TaxID=3014050 RepID=UPI0022B47E1A|nr:ABC transporter substrate-binding protein [Coraliomargarita parva]